MRASPAQVQKIRHSMGLDQPVAVQYWRYLGRVVHGDLGASPRTGQTVISEIKSRLPYTVELAVLGTLLGVIFGIPLGVWAATHKGRWPDAVGSVVGVMGISMRVFWTGLLLIVLFGVILRLLPVSGADSPASYILPRSEERCVGKACVSTCRSR